MSFNREPIIFVKDGRFVNYEPVTYSDYDTEVRVKAGFLSDGVTLTGFTKLFFSTKEFMLGTKAALVHDYMCAHKEQFDRKTSSKMLRDIWIEAGLNPVKAKLMCFFVDLFQRLDSHWKS